MNKYRRMILYRNTSLTLIIDVGTRWNSLFDRLCCSLRVLFKVEDTFFHGTSSDDDRFG